MPETGDTFATRLKRAIKITGISQTQLADQLKTSQAAISQWLSGKKMPSQENQVELADALGVPTPWLVFGIGEGPAFDLMAKREEYMSKTAWRFRPVPPDEGRDYGNANVWTLNWDIE